MKYFKVLLINFLFSLPVFSQSDFTGKYEYSYASDVSDGIYTIEFFKNDSFYKKNIYNEICFFEDIDSTSGFFKIKKDTIILISPIPKNHFNSYPGSGIAVNEFIYLMDRPDKRKYPDVKEYLSSMPDLKDYINSFKFYCIDSALNRVSVIPVEQKIITDSSAGEEKNSELYFKFNIPETALYFTAKSQEWHHKSSVTFTKTDIQGKIIKVITKKKDSFNTSDDYFDLTLTKYLVNKRKTKLMLIDNLTNKPRKKIKYKKIN